MLRDSPEIGVIPNETVEPKFSVQLEKTVRTAEKATQTTSLEEPNPPPVATNCCVHNMEQSNRRSYTPRAKRNFIPPQRNVNSGRIERRTFVFIDQMNLLCQYPSAVNVLVMLLNIVMLKFV